MVLLFFLFSCTDRLRVPKLSEITLTKYTKKADHRLYDSLLLRTQQIHYTTAFEYCKDRKCQNAQFLRFKQKIIVKFCNFVNCKMQKCVIYLNHKEEVQSNGKVK